MDTEESYYSTRNYSFGSKAVPPSNIPFLRALFSLLRRSYDCWNLRNEDRAAI